MRRFSPIATVLVAALLGLSACGDGEESAGGEVGAETAAQAPPQPTVEERGATGCRIVEEPEPGEDGDEEAPDERLDRSKDYDAEVRTNCGTFTIALDVRRQPKTAASFVSLARDGFFDGTVFHRIVPDFVVQGGDPTGTGTGGPGYDVVEAPPEDVRYPVGTVAMAKTEVDAPGTSGSQFYVVTSPEANAVLEPVYAVLGRVTAGRDAVERLAALATDPATERPVEAAVIERVTIRER